MIVEEVGEVYKQLLSLKMEGFHLPILMFIDRRERMEASVLKATLIIDVTPKEIKDPLNHTRVREHGEPILKDRALVLNNII